MASTAVPPELTFTGKVMLIPHTGRLISSVISRIFTAPFTSGAKANTYLKDIVFAALRTHLAYLTPAQEQWLNGNTEAVYLDLTKHAKFQPDTDVLPSGLKVHWLGTKTAKKVIVYFHGGGYVLAAGPGHLQWLFDLQNDLSKDHSVSAIVPSYTLAPHAQYPEQLKQGVECLNWLLNDLKKKPSDIILAGDSAGGNFALAVLSHVLHPHTDIAEVKLSEPLAGALLISPWSNIGTLDKVQHRNQGSDYVTPKAADRWASLFLGDKPVDNYNTPLHADSNWFSGLDSAVRDIFVWGGGGEVLIDSIDGLTKKLKEAHPRVQYFVQAGASHEDFIIDRTMGFKQKSESTKVIESWLAQIL
ncbi:hypothetical protein LTR36_010360 [Oleoguttula mirabilis]|uniref:Alpha/beta hydrolase fold-3 domain-containing protein n=1 Tax=Oleoguttula mirabilis TaxID=1507867 RepID=A0AAV9J4Y8_9PEZI|nr:hypothetical protein LTR36_010360 [Oleoguttula mirabilis]